MLTTSSTSVQSVYNTHRRLRSRSPNTGRRQDAAQGRLALGPLRAAGGALGGNGSVRGGRQLAAGAVRPGGERIRRLGLQTRPSSPLLAGTGQGRSRQEAWRLHMGRTFEGVDRRSRLLQRPVAGLGRERPPEGMRLNASA